MPRWRTYFDSIWKIARILFNRLCVTNIAGAVNFIFAQIVAFIKEEKAYEPLCLWLYAPNCERVWWGELLWDFPFSRWDFEFSVMLCYIKWLFDVIALNLEELRTFCLGCYYIFLFLSVLYLCRRCIYHVDFKPFSSAFYGKHHLYSYVNKLHSLWSKDIFLLFLVSWRLMISEKWWMIGRGTCSVLNQDEEPFQGAVLWISLTSFRPLGFAGDFQRCPPG